MKSTNNDGRKSCLEFRSWSSPTLNWSTILLTVGLTLNLMFTGFLFLNLKNGQTGIDTIVRELTKLQTKFTDLQNRQLSDAEMNKQVNDILSEFTGERVKRSASSATQTPSAAVDIGSAIVSVIKQICKPSGTECIAGQRRQPGLNGRDGLPGLPGSTGLAGRDGTPGRDGKDGVPGIGQPGRDGERGLIGLPGTLGPRGEKGSAGKYGPRGITGIKGETGEKGENGAKGEIGGDGEQGVAGSQGGKGDKGETGARGFTGYKGEKGGKGEMGLRGENGMKGEVEQETEKGDSLAVFYLLSPPCRPGNYRVLNDTWRKTSEHQSKTGYHCDYEGHVHSYGFQPGWHSFNYTLGGIMPETCPSIHRCGTLAPGWLNGSHPSVVGQRVSRTVCFNWAGNCCSDQTTIEVINCGLHYVYNLPNAPRCKLTYCAVGSGSVLSD